MPKFLDPVDLTLNELRNAVLQNLGSAPGSPKAGQVYFDTTKNAEFIYNGSTWVPTDAQLRLNIPYANLAVPVANVSFGGYVLNNVGTPLVATDAATKGYVDTKTLDTFAAPVAPVTFNSQRITNVATPTQPTDAANKSYVDGAVQSAAAGISAKPSVVVLAIGNQSLTWASGSYPTIDGVTLANGERALLVGQTTASQNGAYVAGPTGFTRANTDGAYELETGALWFVEQGNSYKATTWWLNSPTAGNTITVGTSSIGIVQYGAAQSYTASNGVALTGSNFAGVAAPSGGLVVGATGFALDTTIACRKFSQAIGDGSTTTFTLTHGLNTLNVIVGLRDANGNFVIADNVAVTANTVSVTFSVAPAANAQITVTVIG